MDARTPWTAPAVRPLTDVADARFSPVAYGNDNGMYASPLDFGR